eukprot:gene7830-5461_t
MDGAFRFGLTMRLLGLHCTTAVLAFPSRRYAEEYESGGVKSIRSVREAHAAVPPEDKDGSAVTADAVLIGNGSHGSPIASLHSSAAGQTRKVELPSKCPITRDRVHRTAGTTSLGKYGSVSCGGERRGAAGKQRGTHQRLGAGRGTLTLSFHLPVYRSVIQHSVDSSASSSILVPQALRCMFRAKMRSVRLRCAAHLLRAERSPGGAATDAAAVDIGEAVNSIADDGVGGGSDAHKCDLKNEQLFFCLNEKAELPQVAERYYYQVLSNCWTGELQELTMSFDSGPTQRLRLSTLQRLLCLPYTTRRLQLWGCNAAPQHIGTAAGHANLLFGGRPSVLNVVPSMPPREGDVGAGMDLLACVARQLRCYFRDPWRSGRCLALVLVHCDVAPLLLLPNKRRVSPPLPHEREGGGGPRSVCNATRHPEDSSGESVLCATTSLRELLLLSCAIDGYQLSRIVSEQRGLRRLVLEYPRETHTVRWGLLGEAVGRNRSVQCVELQGCGLTSERLLQFLQGIFAGSTPEATDADQTLGDGPLEQQGVRAGHTWEDLLRLRGHKIAVIIATERNHGRWIEKLLASAAPLITC